MSLTVLRPEVDYSTAIFCLTQHRVLSTPLDHLRTYEWSSGQCLNSSLDELIAQRSLKPRAVTVTVACPHGLRTCMFTPWNEMAEPN